jgi:hypothetical protein
MLISRKQTCLNDKMPPKKVKIKKRKKWNFAKLDYSFLILTFWGGILSQRQVCFFEISIKFSIFYTLYDLFQEKKNFTSQKGSRALWCN